MRHVVTAMFIIVAIIHLLPLQGLLGSNRLSTLYGIAADEPNLEILMRHRAMLFGLLGAFLLYAAFQPALQPLAFIAAFASVISFLWLASSVGHHNALIARVVTADWVAFVCLVTGLAAYVFAARQG